jgi:hypothetical protein
MFESRKVSDMARWLCRKSAAGAMWPRSCPLFR